MENMNLPSEAFLGRKVNRDIFNDNGTLLMSEFTVISQEHIDILHKQGIVLTVEDVAAEPANPGKDSGSTEKIIDETVLQATELFNGIRETKQVPLAELRKHVIPMIHEVAQTSQLISLFSNLQAKDDYTYRHNIAVGVMSNLLGTWMGLERQELLQLTTAALLHDAGKMLVPDEILNKPGKLTDEEYNLMKNHTVFGYDMLKKTVGINYRQALVALQHHERMDGSGYPLGIKRESIDLFSRIVAVADIFHAMTSKRVYRDPAPFHEVLEHMEKESFGVLDPRITQLFVHKMMHSLIGNAVMLSDEREGIILMVNHHDLTHPLIRTEEGFVDLSKDASVSIKRIF